MHLSETCDQNPEVPHLITQVHTTPATEHDRQAVEEICEKLRTQKLAPDEQYVDQGYGSRPQLVKQAALGTQLVGPVPGEGGWQIHEAGGYSVNDFTIIIPCVCVVRGVYMHAYAAMAISAIDIS